MLPGFDGGPEKQNACTRAVPGTAPGCGGLPVPFPGWRKKKSVLPHPPVLGLNDDATSVAWYSPLRIAELTSVKLISTCWLPAGHGVVAGKDWSPPKVATSPLIGLDGGANVTKPRLKPESKNVAAGGGGGGGGGGAGAQPPGPQAVSSNTPPPRKTRRAGNPDNLESNRPTGHPPSPSPDTRAIPAASLTATTSVSRTGVCVNRTKIGERPCVAAFALYVTLADAQVSTDAGDNLVVNARWSVACRNPKCDRRYHPREAPLGR
jgi:hypothetical protein